MFYTWNGPRTFDGKADYIDLSDWLHHFLQTDVLSADICFQTENPGYLSLLAVYYKESLLPDFSINLNKGRVVVSTRQNGKGLLLSGTEAYCDGRKHQLSFRGTPAGIHVFIDGACVISHNEPAPYCEFEYVGFATACRGTLEDQYSNFFDGELISIQLSEEEEPLPEAAPYPQLQKQSLFERGVLGSENYRIPTIISTKSGVTIASADARMDAPGDNPNHICRAVRLSKDSGETWSEPRLLFDYGGVGRADGSAAIDGSLLYDDNADLLFMLYSHTAGGAGGSHKTVPGTGFDEQGRKLVLGRDGIKYVREPDGRIVAKDGKDTGCQVDVYGNLTRDGVACGNICHGPDREFRQVSTSFLQLLTSRDNGETWSEPRDLNYETKEEWMRFLGAGPGTGVCIREGAYKGRLVYPVYFTSESGKSHSSCVIYSDDHGETWIRGSSVNDGRVFEGKTLSARDLDDPRTVLGECQVAELPGGRLRIFIRNGFYHRVCTADSGDGGESWTSFHPCEDMIDPDCQSHVLRAEYQGKPVYLFSNPDNISKRVRGTIRLSDDGTGTWRAKRLLEPGEFGYSCMTQLPDGQIGILYEGRDLAQRFVKFPVEWVMESTK